MIHILQMRQRSYREITRLVAREPGFEPLQPDAELSSLPDEVKIRNIV